MALAASSSGQTESLQIWLCALVFIFEDEGSLTVRLLRLVRVSKILLLLLSLSLSRIALKLLEPHTLPGNIQLLCTCKYSSNCEIFSSLHQRRINTTMERSGRRRPLLAVKRGLYDTLVAENSRRNGPVTMKTSVRAAKSPSKADSINQSTMPTSPDLNGRGSTMQLSYLNYRDNGSFSHSGRGNGVNFLQKNRQACSRIGSGTPAGGLSPLRSKIGQAPKIGDALGTPSNKGSSSFMSAGHNGVRDPEFKVGFKKREYNF